MCLTDKQLSESSCFPHGIATREIRKLAMKMKAYHDDFTSGTINRKECKMAYKSLPVSM
jgi:hypothetical protein